MSGRFSENLPHDFMEAGHPPFREPISPRSRMDPGVEKDLVSIDIPDAYDLVLGHQQRLDRSPVGAGQRLYEITATGR